MNNNVRETFPDALLEASRTDSRLCVIVSDISHYRLQPFAKANPGRYFNLGVCENSIINVSAGLAHRGLIPVVHTFSSFLIDRSYEQIKLSFGYQKLPVNLIAIGSGIEYPFHGVTHHSYIDGVLIKSIENSCVFNPGSSSEFRDLFLSSYANGSINLFRATSYPHNIDLSEHKIIPGKGIVVREGKDLSIICTGYHLKTALTAALEFEKKGIDVEIIYLHTIKPLDKELIGSSVSKTSKFIVMEHQSSYGGLYSDIAGYLLGRPNKQVIIGNNISLGTEFVHEYGTYEEHNIRLGFSAAGLVKVYDDLVNSMLHR